MNRLARSLVRLYPEAWRKRYAAEFEAMLEDFPAGWSTNLNLFTGAIRMQFAIPAFPKLALMLSTVGLLAGLAVSYIVPGRYTSTSVLEYEASGEYVTAAVDRVMSRTSLANVMQDPRLNLYPEQRKDIPLDDVIERMRRDLRVARTARRGNKVALAIGFTYPDRYKAQSANRALVARFLEENKWAQSGPASVAGEEQLERRIARLQSRIAALERRAGIPLNPGLVNATATVRVLDEPSLPAKPESPNSWSFMSAGFASGIAMAFIIALFRRRFQPLPVSFT